MGFRLSFFLFATLLIACAEEKKEYGIEDILWAATWSPDGKVIHVGGTTGTVYQYSGEDFLLIDTISSSQTVTNLSWNPDNSDLIVTTQTSKEISYIYNSDNKRKTYLDSLEFSGARGVTWKNDGSRFALGSNEGKILIYNPSGEIEKIIQADPKSVIALDWHPTENIIVTVGSRIGIYDLDMDTSIVYNPRDIEVLQLCVAWHPSGEFFVTGDYGINEQGFPPMLQYWDPKGNKIKEVKGMKSEIRNIRWSEFGDRLAVASNMVFLYDQDGTLIRQNDFGTNLWGVDWHPDGSRIVVSSQTRDIYILNDQLKVVKKIM